MSMKKKLSEAKLLPWLWCTHAQTPSFRSPPPLPCHSSIDTTSSAGTHSFFTNSSDSPSFSTDSHHSTLEGIIRGGGLSDRLFFEPETRAVVGKTRKGGVGFTLDGSKAVVVDTYDPYMEFRRSMEEVVERLGIQEWRCLVELVRCFLRMNGEKEHGFIVAAFLDMVADLMSSSSSFGFEKEWKKGGIDLIKE